jgi:hypothetical protein
MQPDELQNTTNDNSLEDKINGAKTRGIIYDISTRQIVEGIEARS